MSRKPFVFIGSSTEGKKFAEALQLNLRDSCESQLWDQGFFELSNSTFESLVKALHDYDFAVFVLSGDDLTESRGTASKAPRDNVIFELGLFIGNLGRSRVYMVCDRTARLKLPSDLAGIAYENFEAPNRAPLIAALGPASSAIKSRIEKLGLRKTGISSLNNYKTDLEAIMTYLREKRLEKISFKTLKIYNPKYDEEYVNKIIEHFPLKIRRTRYSEHELGIKLLGRKDDV